MSESEKEEQQEPKIVVDTDWKEQVAREKEAASQRGSSDSKQQQGESPETEPQDDVAAAADRPVAETGGSDEQPLPEPPLASFEVLVSMLFTQAMAALGQMPDPSSGKATVNKPFAKHFIDTLEMLGEKTEGNLNEGESRILNEALHALRMTYVNAKAE